MKFYQPWRMAKSEQTTAHDIDLSGDFKRAVVEDIRERAGSVSPLLRPGPTEAGRGPSYLAPPVAGIDPHPPRPQE